MSTKPYTRTLWLNVHLGPGPCIAWETREQADRRAKDSAYRRIACVKIEAIEGDGLPEGVDRLV